MNKLLKQKDDRKIKNSADFYILSYHLNLSLNINQLRLKEFTNYHNDESSVTIFNKNINKNKSDIFQSYFLLKILPIATVSSFLVVRFKSLLILPLFYLNLKILNMFNFNKSNENCYFCEKQHILHDRSLINNNYYNLINYVFSRSKITNLKDFEKELDKLIEENKII